VGGVGKIGWPSSDATWISILVRPKAWAARAGLATILKVQSLHRIGGPIILGFEEGLGFNVAQENSHGF